MRRTIHLGMLSAPFIALAGCNGALWGNMAVLGVSVAIFWGTLSLGRTHEASRSKSEASQSVPPRRS